MKIQIEKKCCELKGMDPKIVYFIVVKMTISTPEETFESALFEKVAEMLILRRIVLEEYSNEYGLSSFYSLADCLLCAETR